MKKLNYKNTLHSCYIGYIVQATIVNLTPVLFVIFQDKLGISFNMLSGLILTNFISQFVLDAFSSKITDAFGYRKTMIMALSMSAGGLILLGILPNIMAQKFLSLVIPTLIFSVGGGLLEVVVSPVVESLPLGDKKSTMAMLHSFYCWGQLLVVLCSTMFIKFVGDQYWYVLPIIWAIIPLCNIVAFSIVPMTVPTQPQERTKFSTLLRSPIFILSMFVMMMAGASEMVIAQWSSIFAEKGLQVSKFVGDLLGPCIFALLMGLGRLFYGIFGAKININRILVASACLCVACFLTTALSPMPIIALIGCGACGLAVSMMWPGTLSMSANFFPKGGTLLFGVAALFG
ncbi:MAG: MFS transporter, partial [Clostridia bacterium]